MDQNLQRITAKLVLCAFLLLATGCGSSFQDPPSVQQPPATGGEITLSAQQASPGDLLTITGDGFLAQQIVPQSANQGVLSVIFQDASGFSLTIPVTQATENTLQVLVPPYFDKNGQNQVGEDVTVSVRLDSNGVSQVFGPAEGFKILELQATGLPDGEITMTTLQALEVVIPETLATYRALDPQENDPVIQAQIAAMESLIVEVGNLRAGLTGLTEGGLPSVQIEGSNGTVTITQEDLVLLDQILASMVYSQASAGVNAQFLDKFDFNFAQNFLRGQEGAGTFFLSGAALVGIGKLLAIAAMVKVGVAAVALAVIWVAIGNAFGGEIPPDQLAAIQEARAELESSGFGGTLSFSGTFSGTLTIVGGECNGLSFPFTLVAVDNNGVTTGTYDVVGGDSGTFTGTFSPVTRQYTATLDNGAVNVGTLEPDGLSYSGTYSNGPTCLIDGQPTSGAVSGSKVN